VKVEGDAVALGEGDAVALGEGDAVALGEGDALVTLLLTTPLFQISFFLDLMQVNFLPLKVDVFPIFEHAVPGFMAASAGAVRPAKKRTNTKVTV
jgi:hypothetical protein